MYLIFKIIFIKNSVLDIVPTFIFKIKIIAEVTNLLFISFEIRIFVSTLGIQQQHHQKPTTFGSAAFKVVVDGTSVDGAFIFEAVNKYKN